MQLLTDRKRSLMNSLDTTSAKLRKYGFCSFFILFFLGISQLSCKKLVSVPEPVNSITTPEVFSTNAQANSAMAGVYSEMIASAIVYSNGGCSIYCGLSADEFVSFSGPINDGNFDNNKLLPNSQNVNSIFWKPAYFEIYSLNSIIEGLQLNTSIDDSVSTELTAEAKFVRAYIYFYLTNLFGDVPLLLTSDFHQTALAKRTKQQDVYTQIIADLKSAQDSLPADYSVGLGQRVRPNKWAATALLSRVYLYTKDWDDAITQSTAVINNSSLFQLLPASQLANVFDQNSLEAIWQLEQNTQFIPFNVTWDGIDFLVPDGTPPTYILNNSLVSGYDSNDMRRTIWIDSTNYFGTEYYVPNKYYLGAASIQPGTSSIPQYYMMLRLAEQYLIRAEAEAESGDLAEAINDVNTIHVRSGADSLSLSSLSTQQDVLNAIAQERRLELFAEWGHRWLDLKRTETANSVLGALSYKAPWDSTALYYPIPSSEIITDPNLTQNPGY